MSMSALSRPLPPGAIAHGGQAFRRLAVARAIPYARRTYWSFRCSKPGRSWSYQYWGAAPYARNRHWRTGTAADGGQSTGTGRENGGDYTTKQQADNGGAGREEPPKPASSSRETGKGETPKPTPTETEVQSDEQRFLANEWSAWEKAARTHAEAHREFLRRVLERDPYAVFFGGRESRGVWNPWRQKDGFWSWPSLWDRWGRRSRGMTEYLESRSQELSKVFEDVRRELVDEGKLEEFASMRKNKSNKAAVDAKTDHKSQAVETKTESFRSTTIPSMQSGDVYIDLITLRKVQRAAPEHAIDVSDLHDPDPGHSSQPPEKAHAKQVKQDGAHEIPVKTFSQAGIAHEGRGASSGNIKEREDAGDSSTVAGFASRRWLKREGFAATQSDSLSSNRLWTSRKDASPGLSTVQTPHVIHATAGATLPVPRNQCTQIQSVLDRWSTKQSLVSISSSKQPTAGLVREEIKSTLKGGTGNLRDQVTYEPKETTKDDVDLLRASDIRAAAGKVSVEAPKATTAEVSRRRDELARKFAESQHKFEISLRKEIIAALKHDTFPTKSPLWAFWMLYDHAGRKDWEKWLRERDFTIKGEKELKEMQYMSKAFLEQMPSPSDIFTTGGSSLTRYLDANRVSLGLNTVQAALNRWHMEMQSVLVPRGVRPFSDEILDNVRRALVKYHIELRHQILSGTGPKVVHAKDPAAEKQRAAVDHILSKEIASQRAAMERCEQRSRIPRHKSDGEAATEEWRPPGTQKRAEDVAKAVARANRDAKLSQEIRDIYEAKYGKITAEHRQADFDNSHEGQTVVWDDSPVASDDLTQLAAKKDLAGPVPENSTIPGKNEAHTILLTLGPLNGDLTIHPSSVWPVLQAQIPAEVSPLESAPVNSFLAKAGEPQRVLREIVNLQTRSFRLVNARKECLVFQQISHVKNSKAEKQDTAAVCRPSAFVEDQEPPKAPSSATKLASSTSNPIPWVTSPGPSLASSPQHVPSEPLSQTPFTPAKRNSPDPGQPIRRTEPHFMGQSVANGPAYEPRRDQPASLNHTGQYEHRPQLTSSRRKRRHHPRQHRRHRRTIRRFFKATFRVLLSALVVAWGAYSIGIVLEWMAAQRALRELQQYDQEVQATSSESGLQSEDAELVSSAMRRWWGRVWWLGEGDTVGRTEWESGRSKWAQQKNKLNAEKEA